MLLPCVCPKVFEHPVIAPAVKCDKSIRPTDFVVLSYRKLDRIQSLAVRSDSKICISIRLINKVIQIERRYLFIIYSVVYLVNM